ncbi:MAG: hypothetical protein FWG71_02770, partial [Synergistaceae bacterium]|nr:hypothetical protein [Synergistaceae bacterium]
AQVSIAHAVPTKQAIITIAKQSTFFMTNPPFKLTPAAPAVPGAPPSVSTFQTTFLALATAFLISLSSASCSEFACRSKS